MATPYSTISTMIQTTLLTVPRVLSTAQSTTHQIGWTSTMKSISTPKAMEKPIIASAAMPESVAVIAGACRGGVTYPGNTA